MLAGLPLWLAASAAAQPGRVDTGIRLRLSDDLAESTGAPAPARPAPVSPATADEGRATRLRGLSLSLTSGIRFDDNALRSNTGERRDTVVVLQPRVWLDGSIGRHAVRLGYEGDLQNYQRIGSESRFDHELLASADLDLERRLKARLESGLAFGSDTRGELESRPVVSGEPDRWREHRVGGELVLGRRIARGQIGLGYDVRGLRYLNNAQQARDFDERALTLTGRYNLGPRFSLVSELSGAWIDYLDPLSPLDSREYVALAGVAWEATAKTRGEIKVGRRYRDFHTPGVAGVSGFTWDARLVWSPRSYSQVTAYTTRDVTESGFTGAGGGSATATSDTLGLRWRHGFTERLRLEAGAERTLARFTGAGEDEFLSLDAGLRYRMNRWIDLFARWDYDSRSSTSPGGDFEAGSVFVGFDARLDRGAGR